MLRAAAVASLPPAAAPPRRGEPFPGPPASGLALLCPQGPPAALSPPPRRSPSAGRGGDSGPAPASALLAPRRDPPPLPADRARRVLPVTHFVTVPSRRRWPEPPRGAPERPARPSGEVTEGFAVRGWRGKPGFASRGAVICSRCWLVLRRGTMVVRVGAF